MFWFTDVWEAVGVGRGGGILLDQLRRRAPGALRGQVAVRADRASGRGSVLLFGIPRLAFPLLPRPRGPYVFDSGAVGLIRRAEGRRRVVPVPAVFVRSSAAGRRLYEIRPGDTGLWDCPIDLVGLLDWAYGVSEPGDEPPANWSHYVAARKLGVLSVDAYVEDVLDAVADKVFSGATSSRQGSLVLTGDTDNATEDEILTFLNAVEATGAHCTLMFHRVEQMHEKVARRLEHAHEVGIHPYAESGTFADYARDVQRLADACVRRLGRRPTALRSHRFQRMEPDRARDMIRAAGIESAVDFVCANGTAWVGAPTGVAGPAHVPTASGTTLQLLPTLIEDEVLLYDVDYSYKHSASLWSSHPRSLLFAFLDRWVTEEGRPVCVNLHPEHASPGYDGVQNAVLDWSVRSNCPGMSLAQYRSRTGVA